MQKVSLFKEDDVELNKMFGFDYTFCHSGCENYACGRNPMSESFKLMMCQPHDAIYSAADLSCVCTEYKKGKEECASQT